MAFEGQVGVRERCEGMQEKVESVAKHGGGKQLGVVCGAWRVVEEDERVRQEGDGVWPGTEQRWNCWKPLREFTWWQSAACVSDDSVADRLEW